MTPQWSSGNITGLSFTWSRVQIQAETSKWTVVRPNKASGQRMIFMCSALDKPCIPIYLHRKNFAIPPVLICYDKRIGGTSVKAIKSCIMRWFLGVFLFIIVIKWNCRKIECHHYFPTWTLSKKFTALIQMILIDSRQERLQREVMGERILSCRSK